MYIYHKSIQSHLTNAGVCTKMKSEVSNNMGVLAGFMVPHPPMIVPDVGRGSEQQIEETTNAYEKVAKEIAELAPDTIIITSPHTVMYADYFHISPGRGAKGDFGDFRAPSVTFDETYDEELVRKLCQITAEHGFPAGTMGERDKRLDHGTMVPLYFIRKHIKTAKIVRIGLSGLSLADHYQLGIYIRDAVMNLGRRAVFVASGDLSHKLQSYGPYGFAPEGPVYDERIMDTAKRAAFGEMLDFDPNFCQKAAECGHKSFVIMAGAFDGIDVNAEVYSHQDVTGVGYGIAAFRPADEGNPTGSENDRRFLDILAKKLADERDAADPYVRLAWFCIENYVKFRKKVNRPGDLPNTLREALPAEIFKKRAGAFVSIHKCGDLRGCIGTILPTTDCIAKEIAGNAVSASSRDPRFNEITENELRFLDVSVDILGEPEPIASREELDVKRYGVIVTCGMKRGLLLPDLDGVDDVDTQVSIAMKKGGISPSDNYSLERFEVIRHK